MATIGHSLVGLSFAGLSRARSRRNAMPFVWLGFMVLMGHVVDVIEWFTVILFSNSTDGHYLTHSPWVTLGFALVICLAVALTGKLRTPWPFFLICACVLSHLILDARWGRKALADAYGVMFEGLEGYSLRETIVAEIWFYGLLLLIVVLGRVAAERRCPRPARIAAGVIAALAIFAAGTRSAVIWIPIYAIGFIHYCLVLRRELSWKLIYGGVFLLPLVMCVASEIHASNLVRDAFQHLVDQDYRRAIVLYQKALAYPQRASPVMTYAQMAQCYDHLGELATAEMYFKKAVAVSEEPGWGHYWLAWFYAKQDWRSTPYYRPKQAAELLEPLTKRFDRPALQETAQRLLYDIRARGET